MSAFGGWADEHGLPVFLETVHPNDPVCRWDPVVAPATIRHWCTTGNRRLQMVADNFGMTAFRDTTAGFRWLTPRDGTGVTLVQLEDGSSWATDHPRWPSSWRHPEAPVRAWGPTWFGVRGTHAGVEVDRLVLCPEGESPFVVISVTITAASDQHVVLTEEWQLDAVGASSVDEFGATVGDLRVASDVVADAVDVSANMTGPRTVRVTRELALTAGIPTTWWLTTGITVDESYLENGSRLWDVARDTLARRLPHTTCSRIPALAREVPWHAALLTGGACVDGFLGGHTLDQGSAYSFDLGFNGAARDPLQHALPLVYCEPDLALSVLRNTCAWSGPDGDLPYALNHRKHPIRDWFEPSDQSLWSLWLAAEYIAATGDLDALHQPAPYHPEHGAAPAPLIQHLLGQYRYLTDHVGVGDHGHIPICNSDWNDSALTLAPIDREVMQARGESVLNSAMAAWVLPRFAGLLRRLDDPSMLAVAADADARAETWRSLVAAQWNGEWFRRALSPGGVVGDDEMWLEVQPWAILCGATSDDQARQLLANIEKVARDGSPLGARVRAPVPIRVPEGRTAGEGSAGGVWFSINMTLAWAASTLDSDLAWDELAAMTLAAHTSAYPDVWEGTLSGPDAYNTPESARPGRTWAWPTRGIGMQTFPVNNLHCHAQPLLTYLRVLGVEPTADGTMLAHGRPGSSFRSSVLSIDPDGHGSLRTKGQVTIDSPTGRIQGAGLITW